MYNLTKEEFRKLAKKGNLIPLYRQVLADFDTPLSAFTKIDKGEYSYLLESVEGGERIARYSFLGSRPSLVFMSRGRDITIIKSGKKETFRTKRDPFFEIKKIMKAYTFVEVDGLPRFSGGLVGYAGYDLVRFFEKIPEKNKDDLGMQDSIYVLTDTLLIFDHVEHNIKVISNAHVTNNADKAYDEAVAKIENIVKQLSKNAEKPQGPAASKRKKKIGRVSSNFTRRGFMDAVKKAKEYIQKGDIIQTVLSQRLKTTVRCDAFEIYRALRSINPSPYMFYLKFKDIKLVGASPEIMVRCEDSNVELRPIAGTRPRGASEAEDARYAKELLEDPKEKAEHIMLVDLGRNDIGRVCEFKSVKLSEFMVIEKYSHVMHIVSDVSGKMRKNKDIYDLLAATFPAGTVSGAPKIRAMEIIDELENTKRGVYAGSVGYFSFSGNLDTCIAIRTILIKENEAYIQAGAGIVADSVPEREYEETLNKAKAMLKAIEKAEQGVEA